MPSPAFMQRMEAVLASRVEEKVEREAPRFSLLRRVGGIVGSTLVCLVVLKAAGLAHDSSAFVAPPVAEAGVGAQLTHWLLGADPVSSALAAALRGAPMADVAAETNATL